VARFLRSSIRLHGTTENTLESCIFHRSLIYGQKSCKDGGRLPINAKEKGYFTGPAKEDGHAELSIEIGM